MAQANTEEAIDRIEDEPLVAHLATCLDGKPHVAPLWYRYTDGHIEIMTTGLKLANVRRNPHVALSIQRDDGGHPDWRVTIQGTATVIDDPEVTREQNRKLNEKYGADADDWLAENTLVRIAIDDLSFKEF